MTRRRFLEGVGAAATGLFVAPAILRGVRASAGELNSELFSLGVASGDPSANAVVLWTRLAPDPLAGGGMPDKPVRVDWEIATDPGLTNVIKRGSASAHPKRGHSVHVLAAGLPSNRWLYYRFHALGEASRVGRTRTFPGLADAADHMRFAVVSCQDFRDGFYPAYADLAEQDLDFVVHVGDYIYENGPTGNPISPGRNHIGPEILSVDDYRNRYALYRLDENLQNAHARFPFIVTWDDHEADNNYAGLIPEEGSIVPPEEFRARRRNAYQVYSETMPLRPNHRQHENNPTMNLARMLQFGDLADLHVLDTRQFRTDQACDDGFGSLDPESQALEPLFGRLFCPDEILDPDATMLGTRQEAWLARNLSQSHATWNVLAQQVILGQWNLAPFAQQFDPRIQTIFNMDAWDGYPAARRRLFDILAQLRPNSPVVLTGDIHSAWGINLLDDFEDPSSDILAAEFVCSSISSTFGDRDPRPNDFIVRSTVVQGNPHIEFFNGLFRGYCLCDVDRTRWRTTYRAAGTLADAANPDPDALIPFEDTPVETDAVLEIGAGFNAPGGGERLETKFARIPIR